MFETHPSIIASTGMKEILFIKGIMSRPSDLLSRCFSKGLVANRAWVTPLDLPSSPFSALVSLKRCDLQRQLPPNYRRAAGRVKC